MFPLWRFPKVFWLFLILGQISGVTGNVLKYFLNKLCLLADFFQWNSFIINNLCFYHGFTAIFDKILNIFMFGVTMRSFLILLKSISAMFDRILNTENMTINQSTNNAESYLVLICRGFFYWGRGVLCVCFLGFYFVLFWGCFGGFLFCFVVVVVFLNN